MAHVDAVTEVIICFRHVEFLMAIGTAGGIKAFFYSSECFFLYPQLCFTALRVLSLSASYSLLAKGPCMLRETSFLRRRHCLRWIASFVFVFVYIPRFAIELDVQAIQSLMYLEAVYSMYLFTLMEQGSKGSFGQPNSDFMQFDDDRNDIAKTMERSDTDTT